MLTALPLKCPYLQFLIHQPLPAAARPPPSRRLSFLKPALPLPTAPHQTPIFPIQYLPSQQMAPHSLLARLSIPPPNALRPQKQHYLPSAPSPPFHIQSPIIPIRIHPTTQLPQRQPRLANIPSRHHVPRRHHQRHTRVPGRSRLKATVSWDRKNRVSRRRRRRHRSRHMRRCRTV